MKLKSLFLVSLFSFLLIPSFSDAYEIIDQGKVLVDIPSHFSLNSKDYSFNYYGNITTSGSSYFEWKNSHGSFYLDYLYGWIGGKLYFFSYESESNRTSQGFVDSFWKTNNLSSTRNFNYSATDFYNLDPDITKIVFGNDSTSITYSDKYRPFYLCFFNNNDSYYYCAGGAPILWYEQEKYSTFTGSLGFLSVDNAKDGNWGSSPFDSNKPIDYYYSTGSCPSVGQLKANSKLIPAVCYGGYGSDVIYTSGESTPFVGGSGLDVFQIYSLTSGGMQLQTWYDTYWVYYNHISSDPTPFYNKPKALLGLQLARQLGSLSGIKGSSSILNYCYYVVNDIPDNTSSCVGSNVSTVYSGFTFTDLDREDTLESIIGWQDSVRIQSGFDTGDLTDIYNQSYSLFSSWTVDPGFNGILPSYIIIGFLGIVLLYFLRR